MLQYSHVTEFLTPVWWKVGAVKAFSGEDLNYLGVAGFRVAGGQGVLIIAICQVRDVTAWSRGCCVVELLWTRAMLHSAAHPSESCRQPQPARGA